MKYLGKKGECITHSTVDVFYFRENGEVVKYGFEIPGGPLGFECMMCETLEEAFDNLICSGYHEEYYEEVGTFSSVEEAKSYLVENQMID